MKKAYIPHIVDQDVSAVREKVDRIHVIVERNFNPFHATDLLAAIRKAVSSYDMDKDYTVLVGSSLVNFLTGLAIGMQRPRQLKLLIHQAKLGHYKEIVIRIPNAEGDAHGAK